MAEPAPCSSPRPRGQAAEGSRLSVLHCLAGEPAGRMAGSRVKAPVRIVRSPWPWRAQWHRWLEAVVTAELSVARGPHPCLLAARSLCWRAVSVPWESLSCACDVAVRHTPTLSRKESVVVSGVCPGISGGASGVPTRAFKHHHLYWPRSPSLFPDKVSSQ